MVDVPLDQLTNRQINLYMISLLEKQIPYNERMERFMADLTTELANLKDAVDNVAVRWAAKLAVLTDALTAAQSASAEDEAALAAALADAQAAADDISSEVAELNALGSEPDVPVEVVPVDELPALPSEETPVEPEAPVDDTPQDSAPVPATDVNPPSPNDES